MVINVSASSIPQNFHWGAGFFAGDITTVNSTKQTPELRHIWEMLGNTKLFAP